MTLRPKLAKNALLLLISRFACTVSGTRHIFRTKNDQRHLIAPIGEPFGFLKGGSCTISIYEFDLKEKRVKAEGKGKYSVEQKDLSITGGFVLKRFATESEFANFEQNILKDPLTCVYSDANYRLLSEVDDYSGLDDFGIYFDDFSDYIDEFYLDDVGYWGLGLEVDDYITDDHLTHEGLETSIVSSSQKVQEGEIFLPMTDPEKWNVKIKSDKKPPVIKHTFTVDEEGLYYLMYQVCLKQNTGVYSNIDSTFKVAMQMMNIDRFGNKSFLTAGQLPLPLLYLYFGVSYALILYVWLRVLRGESIVKKERLEIIKQPIKLRAIHHFMTVLLIFKTGSVFFESARFHFIRTQGHAEIWTLLYYSITFVKGVMLFTIILLLGSGWSFVKPFLQVREKKIIFAVLILQLLDNLAVAVLSQETEGEKPYGEWNSILHIVDIVCCCVVLIPIVWQVGKLEREAETIENTRTLARLKMFRTFYILVVCYIYFTRVVVYLVASVLPFHYTWVSDFLTELGTLIFYVITGYKFRPSGESMTFEMVEQVDIDEVEAEHGEIASFIHEVQVKHKE